MSPEEYKMIQSLLISQASIIAELDLEGFIIAANRAESIDPVLDPTLWIKRNKRLRHIKQVAIAYQDVVKAYEELRTLVLTEQEKKQ